MKRHLIVLLLMTGLFLSGCQDQKILERIGFILQLGLELDQQGDLVFTATVPVVDPDAKHKFEVITASKPLMRESREQLRLMSGKLLAGGKMQHLQISKELAQRGISPYLEIFVRQAENPLLSNVIVVDGSPREMFNYSKNFEDKKRSANYIKDLLENTRQNSYIPEMRISHFTILHYAKTIDPITPLLRYNEKEIIVSGSALFRGDKMVGQIDTDETGLLLALMGTKKKANYNYHETSSEKKQTNNVEKGAAVLIKKVKRTVKIDTDGDLPQIDIQLNCLASLDEYDESHNLDDSVVKKELEDAVAQSMQKDCLKLLNYIKDTGSDPLGIAEMYRSQKNSYYKSVDWPEVYKEATFTVNIKLNFEFYGTIS